MKKYGLAMLLLVCLLISLPVAASDHESVEAESLMNFLQTPETTLFSFPEEITINPQGEVPDLLFTVSEIIIYDVITFDIPLLEFQIDSDGNHTIQIDDDNMLIPNTYDRNSVNPQTSELTGVADLFCLIQHSDFQMI